jgi:hypothetical protein
MTGREGALVQVVSLVLPPWGGMEAKMRAIAPLLAGFVALAAIAQQWQ